MIINKNYNNINNKYKSNVQCNSQPLFLPVSTKIPSCSSSAKTEIFFGMSIFKHTFLGSLLDGAKALLDGVATVAYEVLVKGLFDNYKTKLAEPAETARKEVATNVLKT